MLQTKNTKLKKKQFVDQIFCWIEKGECDKVIDFFEEYTDLENRFVGTSTNWTPAMYACRYGRKELFEYFVRKKHQLEGQSPYTLIHAACFGNEFQLLKFLLDERKMNPTPLTYETTPLKYCVKCENYPLIELLLSRGAYYIHGEYLNNMTSEIKQIPPQQQQNQSNLRNSQNQQQQNQTLQPTTQIFYKSKQIDIDGNVKEIQINPNFILKISELKADNPVRDFIRWQRCRNWLFLCHLKFKKKLDDSNEKAKALGTLAYNKNNKIIKSFLVGPQE